MLRVLVVDDEAPARRRLRRLLAELPDVACAGEAADGDEAVAQIRALAPDLVLLDVQMPRGDGFGVIAAVGPAEMPPVVFVTAHDAHAVRAFAVRALDYLLKPVAPERLREAVARAAERQRLTAADGADAAARAAGARAEALAALVDGSAPGDAGGPAAGPAHGAAHGATPEAVPGAVPEGARAPAPPLRRLLVHDDRGAYLLPVEQIAVARAERNYVVLHTPQGRFRVRGTIGALADRLDPARFLRANRSDVVQLDAIAELQPWSHGDYRIVLRDGTALLWSRRYRTHQEHRFALG
jgi:two-component system LytT family response regulator